MGRSSLAATAKSAQALTDYAHGCGAMPKGWVNPRHGRGVMSIGNDISVAADRSIRWNGNPVPKGELVHYLRLANKLPDAVFTKVYFDPHVDCRTVKEVRRSMADNLSCEYGSCAEGSGKWWIIGDVMFNDKPPLAFDPDASPKHQSK
jgi:hypothetical protein